jgi:uncharacterized protein YdaU (DUF1376 family)
MSDDLPDEKPDAWMPLFGADWDADTRHLDCEQDGAYGRLVRYYWRAGPLPDDDAQLARIVGMPLARWRRLRPVIAAFFSMRDGQWRHKRIDREWAKAVEKRRRYIERAAAGGRAKAAKSTASSTSKAVLGGCSSPSPRKVDAHRGQSTLSGRESADERADGSSASRTGKVVDLDALRDKIASGAFD